MCRHTALPTIMQLQYPMTSQSAAQQPHQVVAGQVANGQTAANQSAIAATIFDQSQQQQGRSHQVRFEKIKETNNNFFRIILKFFLNLILQFLF